MSLDMSQLMENPINNDRFINVTIKRSKKSEKLYAVINEYYSKKDNKVEETGGEIVKFEDELPF
jgi:hypothetical protein